MRAQRLDRLRVDQVYAPFDTIKAPADLIQLLLHSVHSLMDVDDRSLEAGHATLDRSKAQGRCFPGREEPVQLVIDSPETLVNEIFYVIDHGSMSQELSWLARPRPASTAYSRAIDTCASIRLGQPERLLGDVGENELA
jgi:hypothetical protein